MATHEDMVCLHGEGTYVTATGLACALCGEILCRHYESYDDRPDEWRGENAEAERTKEMNEMNEKAEAERTKWMSEKPTIYDETARLEQTTTTNPAKCECWNWCCDGLHRREELLAGHHFRCDLFEREYVRRSLDLIAQLYEAMRDWGNQEDGVPTEAWDVWRLAGSITTGKYQGEELGGEA